jgi:serine/threonine protein kinase/Tfp pilus assembly protein PilF
MPQHPASLIGRRIGAYRVLSLLGAGGMGEVYRARDEKLERDVAIKVLPALFTSDPERGARFEREARMLAALNHPCIGAIYGYEETEGIGSLILELVEGPTLAERLTTGPLPVNEALTIAHQIAEAMEAAHEKGIVHRDLKPANIKLASDGRVKVLDFGLAKTFDDDAGGTGGSQAITMTAGPTRDGVILGTAAYMSPEQARGRPVDKRTDIWAFGCVLYEMLTGRMPFAGGTMSDVVAAILEREPKWDALPEKTPPRIRHLLHRCLQKDHRHRLRDIGDARIELKETIKAAESGDVAKLTAVPRRLSRTFVSVTVVALMLTAAVIWAGIQLVQNHITPATQERLSDGNRPSSNAEANEYYERALLFGGAGTSNPEQMLRMVERALALDPRFAAARAEYAFSHVLKILDGTSNDASLLDKAEVEVRQALQDDPACGRAHSVLAMIYFLQGHKERVPGELDQALEANPNDVTAHSWFLHYHRFNGDYTRALQLADQTIARWPLFWPGHLDRGELLRERGDAAGAIREQERVLEQAPKNVSALGFLARAYMDSGDLLNARRTLERARAVDRQNYEVRQHWALLLALEDKKTEASQEMDAALQAYAGMQVFGPAPAADFYAVMGDAEKALEWLGRGVRMGDEREEYLRRNPLLTNLRGHPRFREILEAVAYRRKQRPAVDPKSRSDARPSVFIRAAPAEVGCTP